MINHSIFINVQYNTCVAVTHLRACTLLTANTRLCNLPKSLSPHLQNSYLMTGEEPNSFHLMEDWVVGVINCITAVDISHCQKCI